jgi:hypothetical protein
MKKIAQATIMLLTILFLSIGSATRAQDSRGPQDGPDTGGPNCAPPRVCKPKTGPASSTSSQVRTVAPDGQMNEGIFFDILLLFIQLRLGL